MGRFVEEGVRVPRFIYGTAWKEHWIEGLTRLALEVGFRGIDTANQRKHYFEAGVGAAVSVGVAAARGRQAGMTARDSCARGFSASVTSPVSQSMRTVTSPGGSGTVASGTP